MGRYARRERGAHQIAFTARAQVRLGRVDELRRVLADMGAREGGELPRIPFDRLWGVHFGRLLLLEAVEDLDGEIIPASLVYMSDVDAPLGRHLDELCDAGGPALDAAFGLCEGYPMTPGPQEREDFLRHRRVRAQAVYVNTRGRTVEQIRREEALRGAIEAFLDRERDRLGDDPEAVRTAIQQYVRRQPSLGWATRRASAPSLRHRAGEAVHAVGWMAVMLLAAPLVLAVLPVFVLLLRLHEARDEPEGLRPEPEHVHVLAAIEDFGAQNQFSAIGFVKPGPFRQLTITLVLFLIDFAARHVFTRAELSGVKTIHFARWILLDDRRRGIFASNYDGSLENYMDDFIDKVAFGLNASFSNAVGYPRTRFLFFSGAEREEEFKHYLRRRQVPTQVWYSAYDQLTARNIDNNALIRSGLFGTLSPPEVQAWLRRL